MADEKKCDGLLPTGKLFDGLSESQRTQIHMAMVNAYQQGLMKSSRREELLRLTAAAMGSGCIAHSDERESGRRAAWMAIAALREIDAELGVKS